MRTLTLSAIALMASASAALAAPAAVNVTLGPKLQAKAEKTYGLAEVHRVADDLKLSVERALARTGAHDGARIDLVLTDAQPNHPTFKQLGDKPGLSMQSFGIGGAAIEGRIVAADGAETPVAYKWYESDISLTPSRWIWGDAGQAFDMFARRLSRDEQVAQR